MSDYIMFTDYEIAKEILLKKRLLRKNRKNIYTELENLFNEALEREVLEHLEAKNQKNSQDNYIRKQLKNAWEYGKENFKMPFDKKFLVELACKIDPNTFKEFGKLTKDYRKFIVIVRGSSIIPPFDYEEVCLEMERFFDALKNLYEEGKSQSETVSERYFDLGAWMHFHLVRIHPFCDNNGRTARMIQNLYLRSLTFPPIIIHEDERKDYENCLKKALKGYGERNRGEKELIAKRDSISREEKEFYDYMGEKLNTSLERIISKFYFY